MDQKGLQCLAASPSFARKLSRRFSMSDELISSPGEQSAELLQLPVEILMVVYEVIEHAPSQVAFALTCKQIAQVAAEVDLTRSLFSPAFAGKLPQPVWDVPDLMKQISSWLPPNLRLCDHCLTARPYDVEYWQGIVGQDEYNCWVQKAGWFFSNASWHKQMHNICPACNMTCTISDYVDCAGCKTLGRVGDVDWTRVNDVRRSRIEDAIRSFRFAT